MSGEVFENKPLSVLYNSLVAVQQVSDTIPERYREPIRARELHMCMHILAGRVIIGIENASFIDNVCQPNILGCSRQIAVDFNNALRIQVDDESSDLCLFPYRSYEGLHSIREEFGATVLSNPDPYSVIGKDILHIDLSLAQQLFASEEGNSGYFNFNIVGEAENIINGEYDVDVLPGVVCRSRGDLEQAWEIFEQQGWQAMIKPVHGTDGNGIVQYTGIEKVEFENGDEVYVLEQKVDIEKIVSIQYVNGQLEVLEEFPKNQKQRWLGNRAVTETDKTTLALKKRIRTITEEYVRFLIDQEYGEPVIFGLDFAIYEEDGEEKMVLIDPNMRMPGNIPLYIDMYKLRDAGYKIGEMEIVLSYPDKAGLGNGIELQRALHDAGIGLIQYDGNEVGINTKNDFADGVIIIVQDDGELSMLNIFAKDAERMVKIKQKLVEMGISN